jgi:hypothetical protein
MDLSMAECEEAADNLVEILFKQDEYCHFRQWYGEAYDFYMDSQSEKPFEIVEFLNNVQNKALDIVM